MHDMSPLMNFDSLGATLLAMADIDPEEHLPAVEPLLGILT